MNFRLRYISGILIFGFFDIYSLIIIIFPSIKYDKKIFLGIGVPLFFIALILEKKLGFLIDKYKLFFTILGAVVLLIAFGVLLLTSFGIISLT